MEVEDAPMPNVEKFLKDGESSSGLTVSLHPLVIINVSDHYTRTKVMNRSEDVRVIGALLGTVSGRKVEIFNSFELDFALNESHVVINEGYFKSKQEQMKKVFPAHEVLGWYSTGASVAADDIEVQKTLMGYCDNPLYLVLDPRKTPTSEVPIYIFESETQFVEGKMSLLFSKSNYKMETVESERISVEHVANIAPSGDSKTSAFSKQMSGPQSAFHQLLKEVNVITSYLESVQSGESPIDHALLREISVISNMLPIGELSAFRKDFNTQHADVVLVSYLASMTKGIHQLNELTDKVRAVYDRTKFASGRR